MIDYMALCFVLGFVLCRSIRPFCYKKGTAHLSPNEYMFLHQSIVVIILLGYFVYLRSRNKCGFVHFCDFQSIDWLYLIVAAFATVLGTVLYISLMASNDVGYIVPQVLPGIVITTALIGYFFNHEQVDSQRIIAITLIIAGLVVLNR